MLDSGYWMLEFSSRIHYLASSIVVTRSAMNLKIYLKLRQKKIDRALDRYLPQESVKPTTIHKAMRYSLFAGGKRLRPILCLAAAEAAGGKIDNALPFACALECIHTYSLVHDDLPSMDNDDLRRGRPTCHKVFGDGIAVLAGDALLTIAFEIVSRAKPTRRYDMSILLREVAVAAGSRRLIAGQVADLEAATALHPRKQNGRDSDDVSPPRRDERERKSEAARRDHKIWPDARSRLPGNRRHSGCHPNIGEAWEERRQRCHSEKGDISGCHRFE